MNWFLGIFKKDKIVSKFSDFTEVEFIYGSAMCRGFIMTRIKHTKTYIITVVSFIDGKPVHVFINESQIIKEI